jgi:hypothetical protein
MKLLTKALAKSLPPLGATDGKDPMVKVKFFDPCGSWTWYVVEGSAIMGDGTEVPIKDANGKETDILFFGLVKGFEKELGYFSLSELQSISGPLGLGIERDLYFEPCRVSSL